MTNRVLSIISKIIIFILLFLVCISVGSSNIPIAAILKIIANKIFGFSYDVPSQYQSIILVVRLPRIITSFLVGASLSVAGAAMQGLIQNPMADGSTLGVTSAGSLGAVLFIIFSSSKVALGLSIISIIFSLLSLLIILSFARKIDSNFSSNTIILVGIVFSMLTGSITSLLTAFSNDNMKSIIFWSMGSFASSSWVQVLWIGCFSVIGIAGIMIFSKELDMFSFGEQSAFFAGVNVKKSRAMIMLFVAVLCGASVSVSGNIAFVGIIIPHIVRYIGRANYFKLTSNSAFYGGIFLMLCDTFARTALKPLELPVGTITSIIGAIVFAVIFYTKRNKE